MKKIAMIYICTGNYDVFWNDFYTSSEKNFLPDCEKHYFVFTDSKKIIQNDKITVIEKGKLEWPFSAFAKFDYILSIKENLKNFDYIILVNANTFINKRIVLKELEPLGIQKFFGVNYLPFIGKDNKSFPYERNIKSNGYIGFGDGFYYFTSAFVGGETNAFLDLCIVGNKWFLDDLNNNSFPIWHDESYVNKYFFINNNSVRLLGPEYGYPELSYTNIKNPSIIFSSKEKYGGWTYLRNLDYSFSNVDYLIFKLKYRTLKIKCFIIKFLRIREILVYFNLLK